MEEEGCVSSEDDECAEQDLLQQFLEEVQTQKICLLEDLSAKFRINVDRVVALIEDLQTQGRLDGVFDDHGKYIYISDDEMLHMAQFMTQRGRVSVAEVAGEFNRRFWSQERA